MTKCLRCPAQHLPQCIGVTVHPPRLCVFASLKFLLTLLGLHLCSCSRGEEEADLRSQCKETAAITHCNTQGCPHDQEVGVRQPALFAPAISIPRTPFSFPTSLPFVISCPLSVCKDLDAALKHVPVCKHVLNSH